MVTFQKILLIVCKTLYLVFLTNQFKISAQIVINELLADLPSDLDESTSEWVEIYNNSDVLVNLSGYVLEDEKHNSLIISSEFTQSKNTEIPPKGFLLIIRNGSSFSLNNSSEKIWLFESTQSASPVDSLEYTKTSENKSIGRYPDGTGNFFEDLNPTPSESNKIPTPSPSGSTASPTHSPRPTPNGVSNIVKAYPSPTTAVITQPFQNKNAIENNNEFILGAIDSNPHDEFSTETNEASKSSIRVKIGNLSINDSTNSAQKQELAINTEKDIQKEDNNWRFIYFILGGSSFVGLGGLKAYRSGLFNQD